MLPARGALRTHLPPAPAREGLSRGGHLGTARGPQGPSPRPHCYFSFLPFSFLINHKLLPNLNMEMPGPGAQLFPRPGGCAGRWRREHRGITPFLVCVKLCSQRQLLI